MVILGWFVAHELRTADPLVHLRLLCDPMFTAGNVGTFANAVGLIGSLYFFNLFVQSVVLLDWSALTASLALLPYGLCVFAASLVAGRLADCVGARWPVAAGLKAVPPARAGEASGVINVSRYIGAVLLVAVGTLAYSSTGVNRLNQSLAAAGISGPERDQLDTVLSGSPKAVSNEIRRLQGEQREAFVDGAREGTVDGFRAAFGVMAVSALLATVGWTVLARRRRSL